MYMLDDHIPMQWSTFRKNCTVVAFFNYTPKGAIHLEFVELYADKDEKQLFGTWARINMELKTLHAIEVWIRNSAARVIPVDDADIYWLVE